MLRDSRPYSESPDMFLMNVRGSSLVCMHSFRDRRFIVAQQSAVAADES